MCFQNRGDVPFLQLVIANKNKKMAARSGLKSKILKISRPIFEFK